MKKTILLASLLAIASGAAMAEAPAPADKAAKPATAQVKPAEPVSDDGLPVVTKEDAIRHIKEQMAFDDANKDGKVSLKEFLKRPSEAFKATDLNKDGFVTAEEVYDKREAERKAMGPKMKELQKKMEEQAKADLEKNVLKPMKKPGASPATHESGKPNLAPAK